MPDDHQEPLTNDSSLLQRVARGDREAFAKLYDRHAGALFGVVLTVLRNRQEAEEALQDAFLNIWKGAHRFDPQLGKPLSWLITVARNRAHDRARSLGRRTSRRKEGEADLRERTREQLETRGNPAIGSDDARQIESALEGLPDGQREAIELAYLDGLTQHEISTRLDAPLGTVKARIRRGLLKLRDRLRTRNGPADPD